jgi:hypothetical protein
MFFFGDCIVALFPFKNMNMNITITIFERVNSYIFVGSLLSGVLIVKFCVGPVMSSEVIVNFFLED